MNYENLHNYIRTRFKDEVVNETDLAVTYDNAPFTEPEGKKWIRFTIQHSLTEQIEIGKTKRFRTFGLAIAQIFVPIESGDAEALAQADTIKNTFRSVSASNVVYRTPKIDIIGRSGKWYQINVTCPFYADDTE